MVQSHTQDASPRAGIPSAAVLAVALLLAPAAAAEKDSTRTVQSTATTSPALLRAGDAVRISVLADSAGILDGTYVVDGRGDVFLPIVGRMPVASRSPQELRRFLDSSFVKYLRYPSVRVQRMVRVSFLGGFHRPGLYYVDPDLSFWDALAQAGGTEREDGLTKLYWVRDDRVVKRDMIPDLASGRTLREIGFESGDEVRVTTKPKRGGWEVFRTDVLPVLALGVGTAATTLAIIDLAGED